MAAEKGPPTTATIPDAEVVEEEKHDIPKKVEVVTVLHADDAPAGAPAETAEEVPPVRIRVETRSKHRLEIKCFEMDDDGIIDIIISDAPGLN